MKHFAHMLTIPMILIAMQSAAMDNGSQKSCNDTNQWQTVQSKKRNITIKSPQSKPTPKRHSQNRKKYAPQNKGYSINQATYNAEFPELEPKICHIPTNNEQIQYNNEYAMFLNSYDIRSFKAFSLAQAIAHKHQFYRADLY
ncbi:MAG: hypothetical protein P4L31_00690 [Candidatus Babeliales bacterium]|nr:hypothetical protein [Candidatus Babeliales bacterium]